MAVSGSKNFELDVAEYIEEAFERCGLELRTAYDLKTAKTQFKFLLAEWANRGLKSVDYFTNIYCSNTRHKFIQLRCNHPTAVIDVLDAFIRRTTNGTPSDLQMNQISRSEYAAVPDKTAQGRPSQYFVDKQITPKIYLYNAPENSTDVLYVNRIMRMDDVDASTNTVQMPFRFYPCLSAGLAYYLSLKKAPERTGMLKQLYEEEFERALSQDEDRASFRATPDLRAYDYA
jgi:hypothetical protein